MPQQFYYPTFYRLCKRLHSFIGRRSKDMTDLNDITGTELSELNALYSALDAIVRGANWPKYSER